MTASVASRDHRVHIGSIAENEALGIYLRRNADFFKTEECPEQHTWLRTNLETFHKVFEPRVMRLENSVQESTMAHELEDE